MFLIETLKSAHLFCGTLPTPKRYVNKMTQLKKRREEKFQLFSVSSFSVRDTDVKARASSHRIYNLGRE